MSTGISSPRAALPSDVLLFRQHGLQLQLQPQRQVQQEEEEEESSWLQRNPVGLIPAVPFSEFLRSSASSPIAGASRECRVSRSKFTGISRGSLEDDLATFKTPLSPQPPHSAFEVLTSSCTACTHSSFGMQTNEVSSFSFQRGLDNGVAAGCSMGKREMIEDSVLQRTSDNSSRASCVPHSPPTVVAHMSEKTSSYYQNSPSDSLGERDMQPQFQVPSCTLTSTPLCPPSLSVPRDANGSQKVTVEVAHTTLSGHRNSQEDAVCIHERVAFPSDCVALEGMQLSSASTYSLYGVFDGHNGDHFSNMASLYYLEHFNEALNRAPPSLTPCEATPTTTQDSCHPSDGNAAAHSKAPSPESIPPQRFLSNALVQSLIHLDRTLYDTTPFAQRSRTGTTAGVAAFYHGTPTSPHGPVPCYLSIANLGDSRAVLARISDGRVIVSTFDHRVPTYPSERVRVERCGGCVEWDRVDGALEVTRSLGDFIYKLPPEKWLAQQGACDTSASQVGGKTPVVDVTAPMHDVLEASCSQNSNSRIGSVGSPVEEIPPPLSMSSILSSRATPLHQNDDDIERHHMEMRCSLIDNVVSNVADVYEAELTGDEFLVLASDGLWDRMSTEGVVEFVRARLLQSGLFRDGKFLQPMPQSPATADLPKTPTRSISPLMDVPPAVENTPPPSLFHSGPDAAELKHIFSMTLLHSDAASRGKQVDGGSSGFATPPPQCAVGRWEQRESPGDSLYSCGTPRRVLQAVANSLADHVVHHLHSADNVTIFLILFHRGR
ncbi:hypothetical protein MOQ_000675 [Trypanosoma cruzi marinkellei]|uniref:protein-serine/threonine phosphatase n=1 Tax=Trypanosoma cruzi marinkellei TaxID=85056 RepID=K2NMY5_TRYCR|nr:hypothetical protein MOQ_000675 [Trypanosoma cruzi marinkellei]